MSKSGGFLLQVAALVFVTAAESGAGQQYGGGSAGGGMSLFDTPSEAACRVCHDDLYRYPTLKVLNREKHHQFVGQPVVLPTAPVGATLSGIYECNSCHQITQTTAGSAMSPFRDCLYCHKVTTVTGSQSTGTNRHHFMWLDCAMCHVIGRR
jgi:hypothetical protein